MNIYSLFDRNYKSIKRFYGIIIKIRSVFLKLVKLIAKNAKNIQIIKLLNWKKEKKVLVLREEEDMTWNNQDLVVKPNLFSTRKLKQQRK